MSNSLNPIRPGTQAELTAHLSDTLGDEVFRAMESVGWETTSTPPTAPPLANPEDKEAQSPPSEGAVADNPQLTPASAQDEWDKFKDPQTGLYLKKYKSKDAMFGGMHSLIQMANDALGRADELELKVQELSHPALLASHTVTSDPLVTGNVQRSAEIDGLLARAKEEGGLTSEEVTQFMGAMTEYQKDLTRSFVNESLTEKEKQDKLKTERWDLVDTHMRSTYPMSMNFVDELQLFLKQNHKVSNIVNNAIATNQHEDGMSYAWEQFAKTMDMDPLSEAFTPEQIQAEQKGQLEIEVRREEVDAARRDAGLLPASPGGVHQTPISNVPTQEQINEAANRMRSTGLGEDWRAMTIAQTLKGPYFDE